MDAVKPRLDGAVPEAAESVSHGWVLLALQLRVPPPAFAIVMFFAAGFEAPAVAEKLTGAPDTLSTGEGGGAAETFNVTFTLCGDPLAPAAATVTVSV